MSAAKLALIAGAALVAVPAAQAQTPGPLDRLLGGAAPAAPAIQSPTSSGPAQPAAPAVQPPTPPESALPTLPAQPAAPAAQPPTPPESALPTLPVQPAAPAVQPPTPPESALPTLPAQPAAPAVQLPALPPPPAAMAPRPAPSAPSPDAVQAPSAMPPTGAARFGAGPTVQFQEPPPAATTLERPAAPPAAELDVMSRLQADIARLRLELEKARLEREIAQQRQPAPTATPAAAGTPGTPARNTASPPPMPIATPRPDPAAADRRALPQVIEIRGAAGAFAAVVQTQNGQRLTLRPGDDLPNSPLKVQSIEPRQVNFVSQDGNRGPYSVPVSPPIATAPPAGVPQAPVMRPINDAGLATPIVR